MKKSLIILTTLFAMTGSAFAMMESENRTVKVLKKQLFTNKKEAAAINAEMRLIQSDMDDMLLYISIGDWAKLSKTAKKLEENYILRSKGARTKIYTGELPKEFLAIDKAFHQSAQFLRVGANIKDSATVNNNYLRMVNTCVKCHANYAPIRFDMFKDYRPPAEVPKEHYIPPKGVGKPWR